MGNKILNVVIPTITSINKEIIWHTLGDNHLILRGGGLALFGNKYSDIENDENKLSVLFWKENK